MPVRLNHGRLLIVVGDKAVWEGPVSEIERHRQPPLFWTYLHPATTLAKPSFHPVSKHLTLILLNPRRLIFLYGGKVVWEGPVSEFETTNSPIVRQVSEEHEGGCSEYFVLWVKHGVECVGCGSWIAPSCGR